MTLLEQNLSVLRERDPEVFDRLIRPEKPSDTLEFLSAASGVLTAKREGLYLHSPRNPILEAEKFFSNWKKPLPEILIMEGFALGYHAQYFLETFSDRFLWIVEPDIPLFLQVLSRRDLTGLLGNSRLILFLNPRPEDLARIASGTEYQELGIVKIRSVYAKNQDYYESIDQALQAVLVRKTVNKNTLRRFGHLWVRNLFRNLPVVANGRGISRLENCLQGFPALLLAAGPSLDQILPLLPELRKRFVLIAVDTSYRAVLEAGAVPDFLVVVDPQYWNTRHLDGLTLENTILISDSSAHPRIFRDFPGGVFFCQSHFPLGKYLEETTDIRGRISAGGSVATFAWETARIAGATPLFCAGLDLGFPNFQTHKKESYFEKLALGTSFKYYPQEKYSVEALYNADTRKVPNNGGTLTLTDSRMEVYTRWFESQLSRYGLPETRNLSRDGIAIGGMPFCPVNNLDEYPVCRNEIETRLAPFRRPLPPGPPSKDFITRLETLKEELALLVELGSRGLEFTEKLENQLKRRLDPGPFLEKLDEIDSKILNTSAGNIAGFLFQDLISRLASRGDEEISPLDNSRELYNRLISSGDFHHRILKHSLEVIYRN